MRKKVYLNGEWDFMPDFQKRTPKGAVDNCKWTDRKITVPSSWKTALRNTQGIWQDIFLEYRYPLFIDNIHVVTSTRKQGICVKAYIKCIMADFRAKVRFRIIDSDAVIKESTTKEHDFAANNELLITYDNKWSDAKLWSPENPYLYKIQVEIIVNDNIVDSYETNFGFREFWLEGYKYYLNGTRINLRTDSWHYQGFVQQNREYALNWYKACRDMGCNAIRLHAMPYPELYLDVADEFGMLIIDESAIYGSGKSFKADHPMFIENCHKHLKALVLRDRNHPCVINWSMQNEMRWIEGREGYKQAMKELVGTMKAKG